VNEQIAALVRQLENDARPRVHRVDPGEDLHGRVAVLPSAFNPPTLAHLRLLELARDVEGIGHTAALLTTRNVDKGVYGAGFPDRIGMLLALHQHRPDVAVLVSNAARIMDQAAALRGEHPSTGFDFVVGFDTLVRVFDPGYYDDMSRDLPPFFNHHRLIATNRGQLTVDEVQQFLEGPVVRDFQGRVLVRELEAEPAQLSSTAQRESIVRGAEPAGLPHAVVEYIRERGLYAVRDSRDPVKNASGSTDR
jgi:nicotinamide-nucleotide adenylyltransferase